MINFCYFHSLINTLDIRVIRYELEYKIVESAPPPPQPRFLGQFSVFHVPKNTFSGRIKIPVRSVICIYLFKLYVGWREFRSHPGYICKYWSIQLIKKEVNEWMKSFVWIWLIQYADLWICSAYITSLAYDKLLLCN